MTCVMVIEWLLFWDITGTLHGALLILSLTSISSPYYNTRSVIVDSYIHKYNIKCTERNHTGIVVYIDRVRITTQAILYYCCRNTVILRNMIKNGDFKLWYYWIGLTGIFY